MTLRSQAYDPDRKIMTADEAVKLVKSSHHVFVE